MVKLSIFEKYAELPKFWQRNLNLNNESTDTDTRSEDMGLSDSSADEHRTTKLRSVCQENANGDHGVGNEAGNELGKLDCRAHGAVGNAVIEGFTNLGCDAEKEPLVKGPVEDLKSLCKHRNAEAKSLTCNEILENDNSDCKVSSKIQDEDIDRLKDLVDGGGNEYMDETVTSLQEESFMSTSEATREPSNMDGCEVTLAGTPESSMDEVVVHAPESDDLCNSDHESLKYFGHKAIYSCSMEDEMEGSDGDDKYAGYWKIFMKNEVKMVITKAKRKTKYPQQKRGDKVQDRGQKKRIKLKLRLS
ncbi:uncharacterized protein [Macrobrachium rosenbergii]|uniref:uncharacterized protein n=1 Tax=Macrobrachium rosenbergii TaxID=79674 RepID=UPI0034D44310